MMERIKHRGPDDSAKHIDSDICLGFRRLSIIDLSGGRQPIFNEDKTKILLFNGEIYNYKDLRKTLIENGHIFKTETDSETLLHGYEEWGEGLLLKLRGMFAFVIWDTVKKELFGARDFFGIKPFYYGVFGDTFMFGSEIKSFTEHPDFVKQLNTDVLEQYLTFQYSPTEKTFFKNVFKLMPAHFFKYKDKKLTIKRYWSAEFNTDNSKNVKTWADEVERVFKESVEAHKISDVEVGSFLSSGIDSSYVAAVADVDKTFTVGFSDPNYSEIPFAKKFSEFIKKQNFSKEITPAEYWEVFPKMQYHMDEPLADPSAVALWFVCAEAHKRLKVALSGEGADEFFGGYEIYSSVNNTFYDKFPRVLKRNIGKIAAKLPAVKGRNFLVRKSKTLEESFIGNAFIFTPEERKELLAFSTSAPSPQKIAAPYYEKCKKYDDITKMQYIDLHLWLMGDILLKADKMSMAHSLEVRVPFLDIKVFDVARRIPSKYKVTRKEKDESGENHITKYILRKAAKRSIPPFTATKKKLGFPVPLREWLKQEEYYHKVLQMFMSKISEKFFNLQFLANLLDNCRNCKDIKEDKRHGYSRKVWTVYTFLVWYNIYFENVGT
jgi:asparagine synthase (glutamine-hydrolysing)